MDTLWQDMKYGARMLLRGRALTILVVLTLGPGIGVNTALFTVVNAVLLRALPYPEPQRLVALDETNPRLSSAPVGASFPNFNDWREKNQVFEQVAAYSGQRLTLVGGGEPRRIVGQSVSSDFFKLLGAAPLLGRTFLPGEERAGQQKAIILSHAFWQRQFGGDSAVLGRTLTLENRSYLVVGVMRPGFQFLQATDVWTPLDVPASLLQMRGARFLKVIARVKPGVTLEQARAAMTALARQLENAYPGSNAGWGVGLQPLQEKVVGNIRRALQVLSTAAGLVLLIACANVANFLLARGAARQREMAIRAALGAGRGRLWRQLLTECTLLGLLGGTVGLLLALWLVPMLVAVSPGNIPRAEAIAVDGSTLGFTLLISLFTSFLFGLAPLFQDSRLDLNSALKEGGLQGRGFRWFRRYRLRRLLVVTEIALALVLLVGAGLLGRSFLELLAVPPGFQPDHLLSMQLSLPQYRYAQEPQQLDFFQQFLERAAAVPGVQAVGLTTVLPLSGDQSMNSFEIEGRKEELSHWAGLRIVTPDYFRTMGIPLLRGRAFTAQDNQGALGVLIINEALARRYWPNEDPIGKRILFGDSGDIVVGVVANVKHAGLDATNEPEMYMCFFQHPEPFMSVVARTNSEPATLAAALLAQVHILDKDLPVEHVQTMEEVVSRSLARPRFQMLLLGLFAILALVLATSGVYGVVAYSVTQRTREIGLRMALGAQRGDVLQMILGSGLRLALFGVAIGLAVAFAATRVLQTMLYGVSATDPLTFAGVALLMVAVALTGCLIPARRASRIEPMVALRYE